MTVELDELERRIEEVRIMAEDAHDKFPIRSTTTAGASRERHIHDLGKHPGGVIAARAHNSANLTISNATNTALTFDSERFDTDSIHSTSSNTGRLTATTAGKYIINANVRWAANSTGIRVLFFRVNGTTLISADKHNAASAGLDYQEHSTHYDLAIGDYVECMVHQSSGGNLDVEVEANISPEFMMARIGAAGTSGGGAPGTDHGSLTGLGDDDHSLYILAAGSRAFTGDQSMGTNKLTSVVDPGSDQDAATKKYVDDSDHAESHDYDTHSGGVPFAELEYDDATSDPLQDADSAADGTEDSAARKDHKHPKHHAQAHASDHTDGTDDIQDASAAQKGIAELATAAETSTGTDTDRVIPVVALPIQIQNNKYIFVADTASDDDYLIAPSPAIADYATGQMFHFTAQTVNTGAATLNVNGKGAKAILKEHDVALSDGDIEAGQIVTVVYDGTQFQMQSLLGNAPGGGGGGQDLATDTLWAAQGDLVKGTGNDTADILSIGADHTVLACDGTDPSWSAAPPLAGIANTSDTTVLKTSASDPNVEIDDSFRCEFMGIASGPVAVTKLLMNTVETTGSVWQGIDVSPTITHSASQNVFAIKGLASVRAADTSDGVVFGLQFIASPQALNKTSSFDETVAVDVGLSILGIKTTTDTVLTVADAALFRGVVTVQSAGVHAGVTVTVTKGYGVHIEAPVLTGAGTLSIETYYGFRHDDITVGTNVYPLFIDGGSDNQDHYSVHEPNLVLFKSITAGDDFMGLSTAAKAGDGVLGWGDAATAPDEVTNPTGGLIMWAASGALFAIGSSGTKTTVAAAEPHCPKCGNDFVLEWANKNQGKHLQVCMWCYAEAGGAGVMKQEG